MFIAAVFIIAIRWEQSKYPSMDEQINKLSYTHTVDSLLNHKEWRNDTHYHLDETWEHFAKWKEVRHKGDPLNDPIYMKYPKQINPER